ncbi:protein ALP1-like [Carassius auratus]|uniref:Protein ALP1-like n=1 Tax=Carassius auratus TaxID=7957 RepID=A0A6P6MF52_CARAU|nr:protein ALP1-like [Carassius auratus]
MGGVQPLKNWSSFSGWTVEAPTLWCPGHLTPHVISVPKTLDAQREVGEGFRQLAGHTAFQWSVGSIDGCHIRIKAPGEPHAQCYRNRKLFPSIQLQAVCDHRPRFIDVLVGSVHDSRVLRHSPLYHSGAYPPPGHFLLGDGGYPCLERPIALLTPFQQPVRGVAHQRFNAHHVKVGTERAFGIMKARWRAIFFHALEVDTSFVPDVVMACTILHNIYDIMPLFFYILVQHIQY